MHCSISVKANLRALITIQGHFRAYTGRTLCGDRQTWTAISRTSLPIGKQWFKATAGWTPSPYTIIVKQALVLTRGAWPHYTRCNTHTSFSRLIVKVKGMLHGKSTQSRIVAPHPAGAGEGTLIDHRSIHNAVKDHFSRWYQKADEPAPDWDFLCSDRSTFVHCAAVKHIPLDLAILLWRAVTEPPGVHQVRSDLGSELALPPTLQEFHRAVASHAGSTSPGATGHFLYGQGWTSPVVTCTHQCLVLLWTRRTPQSDCNGVDS